MSMVFILSDKTPRVEIDVKQAATVTAVQTDLYDRALREGFQGSFDDFLAQFKGEAGARGEQGLPGRNGLDGQPGKDGTAGRDGKAATVKIGTVTSGDTASVTNSGTDTNAVLDFVLPKGEKGEDGVSGSAVADSPYAEFQEGYIPRAEFGFIPGNNTVQTVFFPKPFSRRPDVFSATLDISDSATRFHYINNVTEKGFDISTNYGLSLQGVWYRAAVKK